MEIKQFPGLGRPLGVLSMGLQRLGSMRGIFQRLTKIPRPPVSSANMTALRTRHDQGQPEPRFSRKSEQAGVVFGIALLALGILVY